MKKEKIALLEQLIDIMSHEQHGTPLVTQGQIRNVATKLRLQPDTVSGVYKKRKFQILLPSTTAILNGAFLTGSDQRTMAGFMDKLKAIKNPNELHKYPWMPKVTNLYELACFYCNEGDDKVGDYRRKRTGELLSIMQRGAMQYASDNSDGGHALADLFGGGSTYVFNSEDNRTRYDNTIELELLESFFRMLKRAPEEFKLDRQFAESCVSIIQKHFPDRDLALALYNREAGLVQTPYEPTDPVIHVTCPSCKADHQFSSRQEAEKAVCSACGTSLYVKCPSCGKLVPGSMIYCSCNFRIAEMRFFNDYYNAAVAALKNMDLAEAQKQLNNAKNSNPGHPKLPELEKMVKREVGDNQVLLDQLQKLMGERNYTEAEKYLADIASKRPRLRLNAQRKTIREKLDSVRKLMPSEKDKTPETANLCVTILEQVKDFQPALDLLRSIAPRSPRNFQVAVRAGSSTSYVLSWNTSGDRGVTYRVLRKVNAVPKNHTDGEILADGLNTLEYTDTSIKAGVSYGYAVVAQRQGTFSAPASVQVVNYNDLDESTLQIGAEDGVCRFSWVLPENAIGVRILRRRDGMPSETPAAGDTIVAQKAAGSFTDEQVENLKTYGYRLQCVYPYGTGYRYSPGITRMLTPQPKPVGVKDVVAKCVGSQVTVKWQSPDNVQREIQIVEAKSKQAKQYIGQVLPASSINAALSRGTMFAQAQSSLGSCIFEIPKNSAMTLAVITMAGTNGIISALIPVSSVAMCRINKKQTRVDGIRLKIQLEELPRYLTCIHYQAVRKMDPRVVPWAKTEDAREGRMSRMLPKDYERDGFIIVERVPQEDLYVSVIGEYHMPDGQVVYSDPSLHRVVNSTKTPISYEMKWGISGFGWGRRAVARNARLVISCSGDETPDLYLVCRGDGNIPLSLEDSKTVRLHKIPGSETGYPGRRLEVVIPDSVWSGYRSGTILRLMMAEDDRYEYELSCLSIADLKVP